MTGDNCILEGVGPAVGRSFWNSKHATDQMMSACRTVNGGICLTVKRLSPSPGQRYVESVHS